MTVIVQARDAAGQPEIYEADGLIFHRESWVWCASGSDHIICTHFQGEPDSLRATVLSRQSGLEKRVKLTDIDWKPVQVLGSVPADESEAMLRAKLRSRLIARTPLSDEERAEINKRLGHKQEATT